MTYEEFCNAVNDGNVGAIKNFIYHSPAGPNEPCPCGKLPLRIALDRADLDVLRVLIDSGADFEILEGDQSIDRHSFLDNVIVDATVLGDTAPLERLLDAGLDVNFAVANGRTLLVRAVDLSKQFVEFLLRRGADPNKKTPAGWTPLMYAVDSDRCLFTSFDTLPIVKALLQYGADPLIQAPDHTTALDILRRQQLLDENVKAEVLQQLLKTKRAL